jgi:radical SAM superfamily enzyme YgiQ (UPF0313 family)
MKDKPRILLIAPTALDYHGKPIKQKKLYLPGLTMPMLAAVTPPEVELHMVTETIQDIPWNEHWDLVGLTGMGSGLVRAWEIGDHFRSKKIPVVVGGITASLCKEDWTYEHADCLVTGEAEDVWPVMVNDFLAGRLQKRYKMGHRPDINNLPLPRYDRMHKNELGLWRPVQATRGCPFPCSFCSIQAYFERQYRKRPVEEVIRDVRAAKATGSNFIAFIDDNIGVDWNYFAQLMEALIPENIIWISQCSIHIANRPDMLKLAYRSGCRLLSFGIESVNQSSVDAYGKTFNETANYDELLARVHESGIAFSSEMIVGLEHDTLETFQQTYDFVMRNKIPVPRFYILTPVPGTGMYEEFLAEGRIFDHNMKNYTAGRVVYKPRNMSAQELEKNFWKLYDELFTIPAIYKRMKGLPKGMGLKMSTFLLGVNFHYRKHVKQRIPPGIV